MAMTGWRTDAIRLGDYLQETWLVPAFAAAALEAAGGFEVLDRHEALSLIARAALTNTLRADLRQGAHRIEGLDAHVPRHMDDQEILRRVRGQIERKALVAVRSLRKPGAVNVQSPDAPQVPTTDAADEGPNVYDGRIIGPAGPLARWPFLLKRDGASVDDGALAGSTTNTYQNGAWISGKGGEYHFENLPPASYAIEVLLPSGALVADRSPAPEGVDESGRRAETPQIAPFAFSEEPVDLLDGEEIV